MNKSIKYGMIFFLYGTIQCNTTSPIKTVKRKSTVTNTATNTVVSPVISTSLDVAKKAAVVAPVAVLAQKRKIKVTAPVTPPVMPSAAPAKLPAAPAENPQPVQKKSVTKAPVAPVTGSIDSATANSLEQFFAVFPDPSLPQNALLPSLDKAVTQVYQDTLHLPAVIIDPIRKFYAFMQSQVFDKQLSTAQIAITNLESQIAVAMLKKDPLVTKYQSQLAQAKATYETQKKGLDGSIIKLCLESSLWQKYLKSLISSSFDYEKFLLSNIHDEEKQLFSFIPTFEVSYYTDSFIGLRINSEIVRIFLIITESLRNRSIAQSLEWSSITDQSKLYDVIQNFKKTPDYLSQEAFTKATFGTTTYPLPANVEIMNSSGVIAAGFAQFFHSVDNLNGSYTLIPNKNVTQMLVVDSKTGKVSLTSLGNLLLMYQPATSSTGPSLQYTPMYATLFTETPAGYVPTSLYMEIMGFSAIKLINSSLDYLFNTANLESTMAQLATLDSSYFTSFPMLISYQPSDYLYLDDINFLKSGAVETAPTNSNQGVATAQGGAADFFEDIADGLETVGDGFIDAAETVAESVAYVAPIVGNALETAAKAAGKGIATAGTTLGNGIADTAVSAGKHYASAMEKAGQDFKTGIVQAGKNFGYSTIAASKAFGDINKEFFTALLYYDTGLACAVEGISYEESIARGNKAMFSSVDAIGRTAEGISDMLGAIGEAAGEVWKISGSTVGQSVGLLLGGGMIGDSLSGLINSVGTAAIDAVVNVAQAVTIGMGVQIQLTVGAVALLTQAVVAVVTAPFVLASGGTPFGNITSLASNFIGSIVSSVLKSCSFVLSALGNLMDGVIKGTAYLAGAIIDLTVNIAGGVAALGAATYGGNMKAAFNNINKSVNAHRRVIVSCIGATILTAIGLLFIGTGVGAGIGIALTIAGAGMMAMAAVGEDLLDQQAASNKANQTAFLATYSQYVTDNITTTSLVQDLLVKDVNNQFSDTLQNQERALLYYQNYINNSINRSVQTSAYGLGNFYNQILAPNPTTGIAYADPGSLYGIQTNRLALNPSQGMTVYNMQRNTFAQEVASMPTQLITDSQANTIEINNSPTQFWINQKDISSIPAGQQLAAEIRWRVLSETPGAFYIGIFMSNQYMDQAALAALYKNIDDLQASKDPNTYPQIQAAVSNLTAANMNILNFNNKGKAFVMFKESLNTPPSLGMYEHQGAGWINKNIAPVNYQTGVWYRMKMKVDGSNASVKCWLDTDVEPANWQGTYPVSMDNQFVYPAPITTSSQKITPPTTPLVADSGMGLQAYDAVKKNWKSYTPDTQSSTSAAKSNFAGSMGVITSGAAVEYQVITPKTSIVVSDIRAASNTAINNQLTNKGILPLEIDEEKSFLAKKLQAGNPVKFGIITLTPISADTINQGLYIYTTTQTGLGSTVKDYVVLAGTITRGASGVASVNNLGINPTKPSQALVSLVTNNAFGTDGKLIQPCNGVLLACQNALGIPPALLQTITAAADAYVASLVTTLTFANVKITGELDALKNGGYVYSGVAFTKNLAGNDYFVAASIQSSGLVSSSSAYGQKLDPANTAINGLISLVTGQVFTYTVAGKSVASLAGQDLSKVTITPIPTAPLYTTILPNYTGLMSPALYQTVQQQVTSYTAAQQKAQTPRPTAKPPVVTPPPVAKPTPPTLDSILGLPSIVNGPSTKNINDAYDTGGL